MEISIEKSTLLKILTHCQNVVDKKTVIPILSHVLLHAFDGKLEVTATDFDIELVLTTPAMIIREGKICVSSQLLHDIVKKLKEKDLITLALSDDQSRVVLTSGRSRFDLACLSSSDFPEQTQIELSHSFDLLAPILTRLIETTRPFISAEETLYNMSGIYLHYHDNQTLRAVSCDMHRLACVECLAPAQAMGMPGVILSRKTINEVVKLMEDSTDPVIVGVSSQRIEFKVTSAQYAARLSARLIDAVYPDYESSLIVPEDKKIIVNTKNFAESVDRVGSVFLVDKVRAIRIKVKEDIVTLTAVSQEAGIATEDFEVSYNGSEAVEVSCNVRYVLEFTQQIKTEEMEILLQDASSSVLMRPLGDPHTTFIMMPMEV